MLLGPDTPILGWVRNKNLNKVCAAHRAPITDGSDLRRKVNQGTGDMSQLREKVPTRPSNVTISVAASLPALSFLGASVHRLS